MQQHPLTCDVQYVADFAGMLAGMLGTAVYTRVRQLYISNGKVETAP